MQEGVQGGYGAHAALQSSAGRGIWMVPERATLVVSITNSPTSIHSFLSGLLGKCIPLELLRERSAGVQARLPFAKGLKTLAL